MMLVMAFSLNQTQNFYPGNLPCLVIFKPLPLLVMYKAQLSLLILDIKPLLQATQVECWLVVQQKNISQVQIKWLAWFHVQFSDTIPQESWCLVGSGSNPIDKSLSSSSLHFWSVPNRFLQPAVVLLQGFHRLGNGLHCFSWLCVGRRFIIASSSAAFLWAFMTLVWASGLIAFRSELLMYLVLPEAFSPLPLQLVVAKAVPWASMGATFNGVVHA